MTVSTLSGLSTTNNVPPAVQQALSDFILATPEADLIHLFPVKRFTLPMNSGSTLRMVRFDNLPVVKDPLPANGSVPAPVVQTDEFVDARIRYYGQSAVIQEQVSIENQQPIFVGTTERLQYCYQLSQDQLVRDAMAATTSLINCTNGNNGLTPSNVSERDFAQVNGTLLRNNAMRFTRGIEGEDRFGTGPIASSFLALAHTDLLEDLNGLAQFIPSHQYSNITPVMPAEAGYVSYFRVCLSSVGLIEQNAASNGSDVYDIFCVAREAVGDVEMSGYGVQLIYASPEVTEPRFRTASSLAVKWSQAPTILNDAWIIRLRATLAA
jgi:N4-gp56 family major capsid protein